MSHKDTKETLEKAEKTKLSEKVDESIAGRLGKQPKKKSD